MLYVADPTEILCLFVAVAERPVAPSLALLVYQIPHRGTKPPRIPYQASEPQDEKPEDLSCRGRFQKVEVIRNPLVRSSRKLVRGQPDPLWPR